MILEIFSTDPMQNNSLLVGCEKTKKGAIFDPSFNTRDLFIDKIESHQLDVEAIYLTHSHFDHIIECGFLQKKYNLPLFVHKLDAANVESPGSDGLPLPIHVDKAKVSGYVQDLQHVIIGEIDFLVLHTPGHSPGGVCYFCEAENLLISGDTLFKGSMGSLSLPTANEKDMFFSLQKLAKLPCMTKVVPGHNGLTTIEQEKWLQNLEEIFS